MGRGVSHDRAVALQFERHQNHQRAVQNTHAWAPRAEFLLQSVREEPECAVLASSHVMWMLIAGQGITLRITKGAVRTEYLKCYMFAPGKPLKNTSALFLSQTYRPHCSKDGPGPPTL